MEQQEPTGSETLEGLVGLGVRRGGVPVDDAADAQGPPAELEDVEDEQHKPARDEGQEGITWGQERHWGFPSGSSWLLEAAGGP